MNINSESKTMVNKKNESSNSSDSESDGESSRKASAQEEEHSGSESEDDFDVLDNKVSANSTRKEVERGEKNIKLKLADVLSKFPYASQRHSKAVKSIDWKVIGISGYSQEELKEQLAEIVKATGTVRTLSEVLSDYTSNYQKYEFKQHPNRPLKPLNVQHLYLKENKDKLMQKYEKAHPGEKFNYFSFQKFAFAKFSDLTESKQAPYKEKYEAFQENYKKSLKEFYALHPELSPSKKASGAQKVIRVAKPKQQVAITPFSAFRDTLTGGESFIEAQKLWRDMHPEEKCKYVKEVVNRDTDAEKKISKEEWKILEQEGLNGVPKKPLQVYQIFVTEFGKTYEGERKLFIEKAAAEWKKLSEIKKKPYEEKCAALFEEYRKELKKFIKSLPKEKQALMMQKYKKELMGERKRKNTNDETVLDDTKITDISKVSVKDASPPPKKKKKKEVEATPVKIKQSQSYEEDQDDAPVPVSPKKKKKNGENSQESPKKKNGESSQESPKKVPKKKASSSNSDSEESVKKVVSPKKKSKKSKIPEYPSQSTAHYFMTNHFKGNRKEVADAYKALSQATKAKYTAEMKRGKQNFLEETADYIKTISEEDVTALKQNVNKLKQQQAKETAWHKSKGTDDEASSKKKKAYQSSSSSDSDSDSS